MSKFKKILAAGTAALLCFGTLFAKPDISIETADLTAYAASETTLSDMPSDYREAADWIWTNRIESEGSMKDWSTIYDQIVAGNGTLQYILIWQSYEKITLEQRQKLPQMLEDAVNKWTDCLVGYDDWPFEHVNVKVVGYAVLDESCIEDRQPDEVVYTDTTNSWLRDDMISSGMGDNSVPAVQPAEPTDLSRYIHWADKNWSYNGSYDNRYDMYLHGITGMINMGGYGYHYGQILSDNSVLGLINGTTSNHILLHEMGHGFGFPDYYGDNGASDGPPPNGFPGDGTSIMMAGSSSIINDFDNWFTRYAWSKLKEESGRFDLSEITPPVTTPATTTVTTTTTTTTTITTAISTTNKPVSTDENESVLSVAYDSENNYWLIDTNGAAHVTIQAQGLPYAGLSGIYGYWDNNSQTWIQDSWSVPESLGPEGISTFTVDIPEDEYTTQIQIQVHYYAQWDNDANDMVDKDPTGLLFSAVGSGKSQIATTPATTLTTTVTTTTVTTVATTTSVPVTTTETPVVTDISGDVNSDGVFNIADIVMLQKWLISIGDLTDWKAADLYKDDIINVYDLCLMKRMLIG